MTDFLSNRFTLFFKRSDGYGKHVLNRCMKTGGRYDKTTRAMVNVPGIYTVYIGDWEDFRGGKYTLSKGDLIVFENIPDSAPQSSDDFDALADKYNDGSRGMIIANVSENVLFDGGVPWSINHIEVTNG